MSDVVFVSWNVHVGSGDIRSFVNDLRAGVHTGGRRFPHYVLLLQEAVRTGDVPAFRADARGAKRIAPHDPVAPIDIVRVSGDLGASLIYVPSMRNGSSAADRGRRSRQRHRLDAPAVESDGDRTARRAAAARRDQRADRNILRCRCSSRRARRMESAAAVLDSMDARRAGAHDHIGAAGSERSARRRRRSEHVARTR